MRKSDLKTYLNRYNGLSRLFIAKNYGFIYLRGNLDYKFWREWASLIMPCSLYHYRVLWHSNVCTGDHLVFPLIDGFRHNSRGRRYYCRHYSNHYYMSQIDNFGFCLSKCVYGNKNI